MRSSHRRRGQQSCLQEEDNVILPWLKIIKSFKRGLLLSYKKFSFLYNEVLHNCFPHEIRDAYLLKEHGITKKLEVRRPEKGPNLFINLISQEWGTGHYFRTALQYLQ